MPVIIFAYLALGLAAQCLAFTASPDWTDPTTWMHVALWPGFLADLAAGWVHRLASGISLLEVVVCALILCALAGVRLSRRAAARLRVPPTPQADAPREIPVEEVHEVPVSAMPVSSMPAGGRARIEPRFSAPAG